ncbi:hypothetical protein C3F00_043770, partial [Pseudomonas sp. MWU13-2860]
MRFRFRWLFSIYTVFLTAIGRPGKASVIRVVALALKIPMNIVLVFGLWGLPWRGAMGCVVATTANCVLMVIAASVWTWQDHAIRKFFSGISLLPLPRRR